ncbi:hypothetical protein PVAND_013909 [Polypedilum vanderplanki]|uniref:Lipase domain-containing protein n=1 Tax=Polypedilum vanderplanki TaxID=319348 RepID=A0A9J6CS57_POLVA|nr:hypothetical protein PVAND_013909 [Polypedilum vanderplanki]
MTIIDYGAHSTNRLSIPSLNDYLYVIGNLNAIGLIVGETLWKVFGKRVQFLELIGDSIGAHLSDYINRAIAQASGNKHHFKSRKSVVLDTAGPDFFTPNGTNFNPLNTNDAKRVYVIHTDTIAADALISIGAVDFYPNGGFNLVVHRLTMPMF